MALSSKYKFYLSAPSVGLVEVFPAIDNLEFDLEKTEPLRDLRRNVSSPIVLKNQEYQLLKNIEESNTCETVGFLIDTFCGGQWVRDFTGRVNTRKCKYDTHQCSVVLDIEINDLSKCFLDRKDVKVNLLDTPLNIPRIKARGFEGFIEELTCGNVPFTSVQIDYNTRPTASACIPTGQGYTLTHNFIDLITPLGGNFYSCEITSTYSRQRVNGGTQPLGAGWIALGADWVRAVTTTDDTVASYGDYQNPQNGNINDVKKVAGVVDGQVTTYDNGMLVLNVLDKMLNLGTCQFVVVSNFFGWNPMGVTPINSYYANAAQYNKIGVWQTSDIKRPNAQNNAFVLNITLGEFLENLKVQFYGLEFSVYNFAGINIFRIEHASFYTNTLGLDIRDYTDVEAAGEYEYINDKRPRTEKWLFAQLTDNNGLFDYLPIEYDPNCSDPASVIEYKADRTINNFNALQNNDKYPDDGITFAALIPSGVDYIIASDVELNDYMGLAKLMPFFAFYGRPFLSGTIGGTVNNFVLSRIKQEPVTITQKGNCFVRNWNTNELIRTRIGDGEIQNAKIDCVNCKISLTLHH